MITTGSMKKIVMMFWFWSLTFLLGVGLLAGTIAYGILCSVYFDMEVENHLKRAADANQPQLALQEIEAALSAIDDWGLCDESDPRYPGDCYTSVLYNTPDEDLNFWRQNLIQARDDLASIPEDADPLLVSNVLLKLRETIIDQGGSRPRVTTPSGVSRYPHNTILAFALLLGFVLAFLGGCMVLMQVKR